MEAVLGIILSIALLTGGCENKEDYEKRVINTVQTRVEEIWKDDVNYVNITNREWTYHKDEEPPIGEEVLFQNDIWINEDYNPKIPER